MIRSDSDLHPEEGDNKKHGSKSEGDADSKWKPAEKKKRKNSKGKKSVTEKKLSTRAEDGKHHHNDQVSKSDPGEGGLKQEEENEHFNKRERHGSLQFWNLAQQNALVDFQHLIEENKREKAKEKEKEREKGKPTESGKVSGGEKPSESEEDATEPVRKGSGIFSIQWSSSKKVQLHRPSKDNTSATITPLSPRSVSSTANKSHMIYSISYRFSEISFLLRISLTRSLTILQGHDRRGLTQYHKRIEANDSTLYVSQLLSKFLSVTQKIITREEIKELVKSDPTELDEPDNDGWTPLHVAVQSGKLEIAVRSFLTSLCARVWCCGCCM